MTSTRDEKSIWYQQPWALFFVGILLVSVISTMIFVVRSINGADHVVVGDYYKEGVAINERIAREDRAAALNIAADIRFEQLDGVIRAAVSLSGSVQNMDTIIVRLIHPVSEDLDQQFVLQRQGNGLEYLGLGEGNLVNRWYIQVEPLVEPTWLLKGEVNLSDRNDVRLTANDD